MKVTVYIALFGWIPFVVTLFAVLRPVRAVTIAYVAGLLFLPRASFTFAGFPSFDKSAAISIGVLLGIMIFDVQRVLRFRPAWYDVPMVAFTFVTIVTSLANGLGLYDGISAAYSRAMMWLLPYFIGRIYFTNVRDMRELVIGVFVGALLYVPLCVWEMRMSPNLSSLVYGLGYWDVRGLRYGVWRPAVFLNGLTLAMFMTIGALFGITLWRTKSLRDIMGFPAGWFVLAVLGTAALTFSTGANFLLVCGLASLWYMSRFRSGLPVYLLVGFCTVYILIRSTGLWDGTDTIRWLSHILRPDRIGSWSTRVTMDNILSEHARRQPLWGWGGWGRNRPDGLKTLTDTMWIVYFGTNGFAGLLSWMAAILLPPVLLLRRIDRALWTHPMVAPSLAGALIICLWMVDNLSNAMPPAVYIVTLGGIAGMRPVRVRQMERVRVLPETQAPYVGAGTESARLI